MMCLAEALLRQGDRSGARAQLQWVIDHPGEEELKAIARFRLAEDHLIALTGAEDAMVTNETCACEIVKTALIASKANADLERLKLAAIF